MRCIVLQVTTAIPKDLQDTKGSDQLKLLLKSLKATLTKTSTKKTISNAWTDWPNMDTNNLDFLQKMPKYTSGSEEFKELDI
jgi:hypothetical protein